MRVAVVLWLCGALSSVSGEFFHEPSFTELRPSGHGKETSEFGFSIAYQNSDPARLVVGAPREDFVGKVYSCLLTDISKDIDCSMIDMTSLKLEEETKTARDEINTDQNFFFGASIAATPDYFVTCAPLMTKSITGKLFKKKKRPVVTSTDVFGACYLYNNTASEYSEWMDNGVKFADTVSKKYKLKPSMKLSRIDYITSGGLGWNTLADTDNDHLLVAKTAYIGDILSVHINAPLEASKSLVEDHFFERSDVFNDYYNTGYGMASGYFFNESEKLYAVSTRRTNLKGRILFLKDTLNKRKQLKLDIMYDADKSTFEGYYIDNGVLGSMFGYAMASADINQDGLSELLVGAPTHSDEQNRREFGALHVYVGGDLLSRNDKKRMRTILGNQVDGRFGSAIATNDIDGDDIPEIFVSAPYENKGTGAVYVISGHELNQTLFSHGEFRHIRLSELVLTQRLQGDTGSGVRLFGLSLEMVNDVDRNGCNELAIGSPTKSSVQLFRCLPTVTASTTLQLVGSDVILGEDVNTFSVKVCLTATISEKCHSILGSISVLSYATGKTSILKPTLVYKLTTEKKEQKYCEHVAVNLLNPGPGQDYTFHTKLFLDDDKSGDRNKKVYKPWAVLSARSKVETSITVSQRCLKKKCEPNLTYDMFWSGGAVIDTMTSVQETVLIQVNNTGFDTSDSYVRLTVHGARISPTTDCFRETGKDEYSCNLPKPLKRDSSFILRVLLNTTAPTNVPSLDVTAQLTNKMFKNYYEPLNLSIPYLLDQTPVLINGSESSLIVTDEDLENSKILTFSDEHEYFIYNNGPVTWTGLTAILEIKKEPFIEKIKVVSTEMCQQQTSTDDQFTFHCHLTLTSSAVKKIIASFEISKKNIETDISKNNLEITSKLSVILVPTDTVRQATSSIQIQFKKVLSVKNNKDLVIAIVVIVAVILLIIIILVLYKYGFFKRAEKKKLESLRESVRKRSIRQASESSRSHKHSTADVNPADCEIEVVDDCVFRDIDISSAPQCSKDDVMLIKDKPEVVEPSS